MGEGGAVLVNHEKNVERAEIIREKGTNRTKFFRGQVDKYTWVDLGSSYLQSELNCAYLYAQIENPDIINNDRLQSWNTYYELLTPLKEKGCIDLPVVPAGCVHNAHMFYIKTKDLEERSRLIAFLKENKLFDSSILSYEYASQMTPRYDAVIVDEVQDFTNSQLSLILKTLKDPSQFLLCGDANQIVHPNFSLYFLT